MARPAHTFRHADDYASSSREIRHPPRSVAERVFGFSGGKAMPRGGHVAALEAPELLAADVAAFVGSLRGG